ncbi:MAG: hypothetical protein PHC33_00020 [Candidatus Omnitrophica bacterium]|nr:hypothetical protein [Candidatus Omnitrophota bacterium]
MKRLALLTVCLFLLGTACVFAQNAAVTTTQTTNMHESYTYNAFGVAVSGTQRLLTTTISTNDEGQRQVTVTETTNQLESTGGSLKVVSSHLESDTASDDGANSHTEGDTTYTYNANGQLAGASGTAHTTGDRGRAPNEDGEMEDLGTFESDTTETYEIRNGQALRTRSVTTGTNFGPDGEETSTFTETTTYDYDLVAGSWQLMSETSHSRSDSRDGSFSDITKTKTYQRNGDGIVTGLSQTATGTQFQANG